MRKLLLILSLLAALPSFAQDFEFDGIWYTVLDEEAKTCMTRPKENFSMTQPGYDVSGGIILPGTIEYNGESYTLTEIGGETFRNCSDLTSVTIPNSVTSIGDAAFYNCTNLSSITIPNSVASIGGCAFDNCTNLSSITIPNSVTSIGMGAFHRCTSLTSVTIPSSVTAIEGWTFDKCEALNSVDIPNSVTSIGQGAFWGCSALASISIPNSVTSIDEAAFAGCTSLSKLTLEDGEETIIFSPSDVFYDCPIETLYLGRMWSYGPNILSTSPFSNNATLKNLTISNSITSIDSDAFYGCSELTSIIIPRSVTSLGYEAFSNCEKLENISVERGNQYFSSNDGLLYNIDKTVLICCPGAKTTVEIPNSVTSIGTSAFMGCSKLTSLIIPNSVTQIGDRAFYCCSSLQSINIPNSVTTIGGGWTMTGVFKDCSSLTSVVLPDKLTKISGSMFENCTALTSISIPNSVTSICNRAFCGCSSLTSITIPNSVTYIEDLAFCYCTALTDITIPNSVTSINGATFSHCSSLTSISIPNSVTSIGRSAFSSCSSLTSISIPNSVTSIGEDAFTFCGLKDIYCLTDNPITISSYEIFSKYIFTSATLHVPETALEKIKSTEPWMNFEYIDTNIEGTLIANASPIFNEATGDVITIGSNSKSELAPAVHAFGSAKGVQFDLTLPKGLSLSDVTVFGDKQGRSDITASHAKLENGDFRVLIYTNDDTELGDMMLGMSFASDATLERGTALCHNIIHSIFDTEVTLSDETVYVTGYDVTLPEVSIEELETFTLPSPLSATVENVTYRWGEVEPSDIATLSSEGIITSNNPGQAVYSLYVKDGERPEKKYTAMLEVIASLWGDADNNGSVNISDLVAVVNYILERSPENFDTRLADIDHNGRINIVDLTGIVKLILSKQKDDNVQTYSTYSTSSARRELAFGEVTTLAVNRHRIALEIEPTDEYTALQTDIRLPEGVEIEALTLGTDLGSHTVDYAGIDASTVRVIIYSPSLAGMTSGKKTVVADLVLSGELTDDAVITATETLACDTEGYSYTLASTEKSMGGTTAIASAKADGYQAITVHGGIELIAPETTAVWITDLSGRCVAETVAPTTVSLETGVYLVTFENIVTLKILVK